MLKKVAWLSLVAAFVVAVTGASASWEKGAYILPKEPDDIIVKDSYQ